MENSGSLSACEQKEFRPGAVNRHKDVSEISVTMEKKSPVYVMVT
jgi:hypothetical protein